MLNFFVCTKFVVVFLDVLLYIDARGLSIYAKKNIMFKETTNLKTIFMVFIVGYFSGFVILVL